MASRKHLAIVRLAKRTMAKRLLVNEKPLNLTPTVQYEAFGVLVIYVRPHNLLRPLPPPPPLNENPGSAHDVSRAFLLYRSTHSRKFSPSGVGRGYLVAVTGSTWLLQSLRDAY